MAEVLPAVHPSLACTLQINDAGGVKKLLFNWGFARKLHFLKQGFAQDKVRTVCSSSCSLGETFQLHCLRRALLNH